MAKYVTATRSCGHTERVLVNYKITDMEEWESRQAEQLCFECQKQKRLEEAREQVAGLDLPPLTGSPKQIAWAETIRADIIKNVGERLNYFLENTDQFARMIEKHNIEPAAYVDENIVKCLMRKEDLLRFFKSNLSVEQARKLVKGEAL
ncbi:MAG: hypothetical protein GX900_06595 [Clostridiaceae bacterium]|nr:hypothetical protein [Clostridiaceae bacterium]